MLYWIFIIMLFKMILISHYYPKELFLDPMFYCSYSLCTCFSILKISSKELSTHNSFTFSILIIPKTSLEKIHKYQNAKSKRHFKKSLLHWTSSFFLKTVATQSPHLIYVTLHSSAILPTSLVPPALSSMLAAVFVQPIPGNIAVSQGPVFSHDLFISTLCKSTH